jgi:nicotinate-nucleotide--dimethylbenzimidazole phosphoribosyltransferase
VDALVAEPLPGVVATLRALSTHHRLAAVTDTAVMTEKDVRRLLAPAGIDELLEVVVTSCDVGAAKPDSLMLREALRRLGVAHDRALLIGDRDVDRDAAAAAGVAFAAVDRGLDDALTRVTALDSGALGTAMRARHSVDEQARADALTRHEQLTKPSGALGRLEVLGAHLAAVTGRCPPRVPQRPAVAVFAGDHGVVASGVTPWPQDITAQMAVNFVRGGAAINVLARQVGADVHVVDVGIATDMTGIDGIEHRNIRRSTDDLSQGPAMSSADALAALEVGADVASALVARGHDLLATGEMGIGNTTAAAALIATLTGCDASTATGRGTGIDDEMLAHKAGIVAAAAARAGEWLDPVSVLAEIGGLEIAALAGFVIGGTSAGVIVVIDGVIACAAALVADAVAPGVRDRIVAGHRSSEPGARVALDHLRLDPLLDLDMRLGEGTGACLAIPLVQAAAAVLNDMATFDDLAE